MDLTFVLTRDEIYVPVAVRKPKGDGPFPVITMGRGDGRGGMPHVEKQVERLAAMQDRMISPRLRRRLRELSQRDSARCTGKTSGRAISPIA